MSTPTKPVNIRPGTPQNNDSSSISGSPGIRALRAQYGTPPIPNIPPRNIPVHSPNINIGNQGTGSPRPSLAGTPIIGGIRMQAPGGPGSGTRTPASGYENPFEELTEEEKARILRRHLVSREQREQQVDRKSSFGSFTDRGEGPSRSKRHSINAGRDPVQTTEDPEPFPIPYHTPGADLTHNIYKWQSEQRRVAARPRSASFAGSTHSTVNPAFANIHEPGGFRRNYLIMRAHEQGEERPEMASSFIEFLYLFGHFAGEDLEEIEEEDEEPFQDEEGGLHRSLTQAEAALSSSIHFAPDLSKPHDETAPLIQGTISKSARGSRIRRKRASSISGHGDASVTDAVLMLLKAFVGTGVLFLGKAFYNGGILFSSLVLVFIALISLWSFLLLVKTKFVVSGSFGDIGGALYGPYMRIAILGSITVSQIGFVSAYTIFVAENLRAFVMAVTDCTKVIPVQYFILMQLVIFLPFALIRNLAKLSTTALVADAFILAGLVYIFSSEFSLIAERGAANVAMFNGKDFPLLIGTAVFSFEGIGLIIPITDAMKEPRKFPKVLSCVMIFLILLFGGAGALAYLTFGDQIQTVVIVNLDPRSKMVQAVQFLYSLAILLSTPLQLFPAVRIMENGLFTRSGKQNLFVKWQKNVFRFSIVVLCTVISWTGAQDLDKFVAFIGSFACVPLCFVYPPMLHYKACARTTREKVGDIALMIFGLLAAVYTTVQTVKLMFEPGAGGPTFGHCSP